MSFENKFSVFVDDIDTQAFPAIHMFTFDFLGGTADVFALEYM